MKFYGSCVFFLTGTYPPRYFVRASNTFFNDTTGEGPAQDAQATGRGPHLGGAEEAIRRGRVRF